MKLNRRGARRDHGASSLVSEDLAKRNKWTRPDWNGVTGEFRFVSYGADRGVSYRYEFAFTAADMIAILEGALPKQDSAASRAVCAGAIGSLKELLVPKESSIAQKVAA